ncbi:hypothetical protein [Pseudoalteromonas porphyrae]|uniref:DUF7691 domain-containing protein n=2 Tax=Pseudoalteromonas TaxID=53246 RepID=A0A0N0LU37_9GAMM|nr:hypothetical protein [Pseudoalteromonas porphyrae]KPH56658.1 hypothetical protein ADS77_20885 [Pseudoalteromonas porphyrae]
MGYGVVPFRMDLDLLSSILGPKNAKKGSYEVMFGILKSSLAGLDDQFEIEDGWLPATDILSLFLNGGTPQIAGNCTKHWYVIERIIQVFGVKLNNNNWYPSDAVDVFYDYDEFKIYKVDREGEIKIGLPDDFPIVFSLERKDFSKALKNIGSCDISVDQKMQFESWIADSDKANNDLILYYY